MLLVYSKFKNAVIFFKVFYFFGKFVLKRGFVFFLFITFTGLLGDQKFLVYFFKFKNYFLIRSSMIYYLNNSFNIISFGITSGWFLYFVLAGYNYKLKSSFFNCFLLIYLGFFYSFLFKFPQSIKIFKRKRGFILFSSNLLDFNFTVHYLRHLRDLYPYKKRGLVLNNEVFKLKQGKKVKFR